MAAVQHSKSTHLIPFLRSSVPYLQPLLLRQLILRLPRLHLLVIDALLIDCKIRIRVDLCFDPLYICTSASLHFLSIIPLHFTSSETVMGRANETYIHRDQIKRWFTRECLQEDVYAVTQVCFGER